VNFFQAQDTARRKTGQLSLLFAAAVIALLVLANGLVALALGWAGPRRGLTFDQALANVSIDTWFWISFGVLGVIAVASLYKYLSIQGGGRVIAEALGGNLIHQSTRDHQQRQLLNVVEEMAIAAGVPVPPVYLIPEPSINAFAAGFSPDDAVIGINQGTLDQLNRSELQGVVAHEFSHILNGDTNINLRLIAILHGILFLGMVGYGLLRAGSFSRRDGLPVVAIGIGLVIVGYGGTFFGNMIKAAISRQREYLADASAVQFTRDPGGIADALKKIGGFSAGSHMENPAAEQASHMFFGAAAPKFAHSFTATHPPLEKRIKAIEPSWNGTFTANFVGNTAPRSTSAEVGLASNMAGSTAPRTNPSTDALIISDNADHIVNQVGALSENSLVAARQVIAEQPADLSDAAHDPFEARALIYAMLVDKDAKIAQKQQQLIQSKAEPAVVPHVQRLLPAVHASDSKHLLTLLEMSIPALKELSFAQYKNFSQISTALITADEKVDVFEWVLHRVLMKELYPHFEGPQNYHGRTSKISKVAAEASKLLSILASHSSPEVSEQIAAYNLGAKELGLNIPYAKQDQFDYQRMNEALSKLRKLKPLVKPALIKACALTVMADGEISSAEGALMQGIAATLDCPLPPSIY